MRTGIADTPLHGGKAPAWLFQRMRALAREIAAAIVSAFGPHEFLRRISDPYWFQAFGCVLGFDWHSSGVTTTTLGALKDGLKDIQHELGLFVTGGKGATSRKTPLEIETIAERLGIDPSPLVYASRMSAKVDSSAVQDGFQIYHHNLIFTSQGDWAVVQQGMNELFGTARRYHWLSDKLLSFVNEPHAAVVSEQRGIVLNMVAAESKNARSITAELSRLPPDRLLANVRKSVDAVRDASAATRVGSGKQNVNLVEMPDSSISRLTMPQRHHILVADINPDRLKNIFAQTYERQPENFEALLGLEGVGGKTIRALALVGEIIYGVPASFRDPARFSFAHGGKDGHPYPVDRAIYDRTIDVMKQAVEKAKIGRKEKLEALHQLALFFST
ncbi:MAG: DUF763 domain-containing protein [Bacteroidota bacterium]